MATSAVQVQYNYIGPMNTFAHWRVFFDMLAKFNLTLAKGRVPHQDPVPVGMHYHAPGGNLEEQYCQR
jgi:hypothetical protein